MNADRLGAVDATYLAIEDPRTPLHVASIGIFDRGNLCDEHGALRLDEVRARIDARLGMLPRLRQRVVEVPFGVGRPLWVDAVDFDIADHVDCVSLPSPHDEAALLRLAEELVMQPLDRGRPLWHLRFVTGLTGGRVALIERAHHAMVDGVSGVDVSLVLLDATPDAPDTPAADWQPRPVPSPTDRLLSAFVDRGLAPVEAALRTAARFGRPADVVRGIADAMSTVGTLRRDGLLAPRCSLNRPIGTTRLLSLVRQRLDAVHDAGAATGATVNDVVLTAVAGGLRELLLGRGEALPAGLRLKVLVPVSVRGNEESMMLGNRVGALLAPLPVGIGDPHARLAATASITKALKHSDEAATADQLLRLADLLPQSVAELVQRGVHHQPFVNMVVTNVPGPPFPLYAMGARMLEAFPVVPLGGNMPLEVAILSYDGALNLCVTSDRTTCPDAPAFVHGLEHSFEVLGARWAPALAS
jgi:WS/DGAT/MGAT family acyltransferase